MSGNLELEFALGVALIGTFLVLRCLFGTSSGKKGKPYFNAMPKNRISNGNLPKPFPNTWYFLCESKDLQVGTAKAFSICGKDLVAFRNKKGQVGVLTAYCVHLGTHMGYNSSVNENNLVCGYHGWEFGVDGKVNHIPYYTGEKDVKQCNHLKAEQSFPHIERHGMIFIWFSVEPEEPKWELSFLKEANYSVVTSSQEPDTWKMHIMDPSQNSTDHYHFITTHHSIPFSMGILQYEHKLETEFREHVSVLKQEIYKYCFLGRDITSFMPKLIKPDDVEVEFHGPSVACFNIYFYKFFTVKVVVCFTPLKPLEQNVFIKTLVTGNKFFGFPAAKLFHHFVIATISEDKPVWETKTHKAPMVLVRGDPKFVAYHRWLKQFYSESSSSWKDVLNDTLEW